MMYNPNFNYGEFATIKEKAGLNNFKVSVKELVMRRDKILSREKTCEKTIVSVEKFR